MAVSVRTLQNFVGGDWVESTSETARETVSPVTGETLAEAPVASSDEEALSGANDSNLGLQAAVYTSSLKRAFRFLDNLQVGNVVVNDSTLE